jgi:ATP adenylyltransferase
MDILRAPWRMSYINSSKNNEEETECIFCKYPTEKNDDENLIITRGTCCYALLNRYPYSNGHLMIVPYRHTADMCSLSDKEKLNIMSFSQTALRALKATMNPDGFNLGMNLGKVAGAGIDSHLHLHIVPRWNGDTNFMSVTAETKVLPEALSKTWEKLSHAWNQSLQDIQ